MWSLSRAVSYSAGGADPASWTATRDEITDADRDKQPRDRSRAHANRLARIPPAAAQSVEPRILDFNGGPP